MFSGVSRCVTVVDCFPSTEAIHDDLPVRTASCFLGRNSLGADISGLLLLRRRRWSLSSNGVHGVGRHEAHVVQNVICALWGRSRWTTTSVVVDDVYREIRISCPSLRFSRFTLLMQHLVTSTSARLFLSSGQIDFWLIARAYLVGYYGSYLFSSLYVIVTCIVQDCLFKSPL